MTRPQDIVVLLIAVVVLTSAIAWAAWCVTRKGELKTAVVESERLDGVGYVYTARHRGHLYCGTMHFRGGASVTHSPECECLRQVER